MLNVRKSQSSALVATYNKEVFLFFYFCQWIFLYCGKPCYQVERVGRYGNLPVISNF